MLFICVYILSLGVCVTANNATCPTWFHFNGSDCVCDCLMSGVRRVGEKIEISKGFCATFSQLDGQYYGGSCPFFHLTNRTNRKYAELPSDPDMLDDAMCGPYNRKGLLCGECIDGYGPAVYSYDIKCANCTVLPPEYAMGVFLFLELVPGTVFFLCLVFLHLNITSGPLLGYVLFCQLYAYILQEDTYVYEYIVSDTLWPLRVLFNISLTLCDFWNLRFFKHVVPSFCISDKLTGIHIQMLNLVATAYPIVLVIITCILMELHARNCRIIHILWKPFSIILNKTNTTAVTGDAVIQAFASFILLSASTLLYNTVAALKQTHVYQSSDCSLYRRVVFSDPTVTWLSHRHLFYVVVVFVPFVLLFLIPSLLLCLYPTRLYSRYLSRCLSARNRLAITTFAEALHRCFKDGLNGTRDYRSLPGVFLLSCTVGPQMISEVTRWIGTDVGVGFTLIIVAFLLAHTRPCKSATANLSLSYHFMAAGTLSIFLYIWRSDNSVHSFPLELIFILVPVISHVIVFSWAGWSLYNWAGPRCDSPHCKSIIHDLIAAVKGYYFQQRYGYQVLLDV